MIEKHRCPVRNLVRNSDSIQKPVLVADSKIGIHMQKSFGMANFWTFFKIPPPATVAEMALNFPWQLGGLSGHLAEVQHSATFLSLCGEALLLRV